MNEGDSDAALSLLSMIIRGTRQKLHRNAARGLQPLFDQLQFPWLCPALYNDSRQQKLRRSATSIERKHNPRLPPVTAGSRISDRGYAHAAPSESFVQDDYVPWDAPPPPSDQLTDDFPFLAHRSVSELPQFDPSTPLVLPDSLQLAPRNFRHIDGIGGEISDIHRVLHACLQVGQLDRASTTVRRLNTIYKADSPELVEAHNAYLSGLVAKLVNTRDQELLRQLHKWFEVEMRGIGVRPSATTIALMLQGSLQDDNEKKVGRTVRRLFAIAEDYEIYDAVLDAVFTRLSPVHFTQLMRFQGERLTEPIEETIEEQSVSSQGVQTPHPKAATTPSILPQKQKGLGLSALQKSLSLFSPSLSELPQANSSDHDLLNDLSRQERQRRLEMDTITSALERWRVEHEETVKRVGVHSSLQSKSLGAIMWTWHQRLQPAIVKEIQEIRKLKSPSSSQQDTDRSMYGPFLQQVSPEILSATTILMSLQALTRSGSPKGIGLTKLITEVGKAVEEESEAVILQNKLKEMSKKTLSKGRSKILAQLIKRKRGANVNLKVTQGVQKAQTKELEYAQSRNFEWSSTITAKVGAALVSLLYKVAKVEMPGQPSKMTENGKPKAEAAFKKYMKYSHGRSVGMIGLHDVLVEKIQREPIGSAIAKHLPMLVEPVPWTGFKEGGFLQQPVAVVRTSTGHAQTRDYVKLASKSGDMSQVYRALDVLGRTPWKINRAVFDIMVNVWNSGEGIGEIAPLDPKLDYPVDPGSGADKEARRLHAYKVKHLDNVREGYHSNRCFQNFQLEVARAFSNEDFYFPHNMDFRGRAYPVPPYLNHMGADHCRGLLMFGKGRELGENGLAWLRVQLANVFGYDKASLTERRDFTYQHIEDVYDSAKNPLNGRRWWLQAEDPWQCLAACIELTNALKSPDPTKYVSHLPVHQDGTCNGLQHYAALGGDSIGAKQVNLEPGDRPSDIYTAVAEMVQERIAVDAEAGDPMAQLLDGKIKRKVVKQTVMTNVYGVTFAGAKMQVLRQLEDLYPETFKADPRKLFTASIYIARKIFQSLSVMFTGAHDIQYWLGECASRICDAFTPQQIEWIEENASGKTLVTPFSALATNQKSVANEHSRFKTSVIWTTPLKMPIVQPYRKTNVKTVSTNFQKINLVEPSVSDPVSKRKQLQAFPPNFIHSLDATHMFLSALKCDELGLSFAAVHDSFWTHAADVDTMNQVIRDAFIKMHSENIIGRLAAEFHARYKGGMYLASVKFNSAVGRKIQKLRRASRASGKSLVEMKLSELLEEKKRLDLLASSDEKEREIGAAMVTPAKLIDEAADERDLEVLDDLDGAIGEVKDEDISEVAKGVEESHTEAENHYSALLGHVPATAAGCVTPESIEELQRAEKKAVAHGKKRRLKQRAKETRKIWVWRPLTFPPIPDKVSLPNEDLNFLYTNLHRALSTSRG